MFSLRSHWVLALSLTLPVVSSEKHWAVLVAGSQGFDNYRHQADVCHAYHVLTKRGFHPDRVITMMFDDVAMADENPYPGKLYNYPWKSMSEAVDVYEGCKVDYRGKNVTPATFLGVLTGNASVPGHKVLRSTAEDHVFINFVDHGAAGLIAFPNNEVLHAKELNAAIRQAHGSGKFKQLTFYMETCESGSMFQGLLHHTLPVYAVTAANATESSWGTFCPPQATVAGKNLNTCLGDLFSVNWMTDSDRHWKNKETLNTQFARVRRATHKSHVERFGQLKQIKKELVNDFQGPGSDGQVEEPLRVDPSSAGDELALASAVKSRDVRLHRLYQEYTSGSSDEAAARLIAEIQERQMVKALGLRIATTVLAGDEKRARQLLAEGPEVEVGADFWKHIACHERCVEAFGATCGWDEKRLELSSALHRLCDHTGGDATQIVMSLHSACGPHDEQAVVVV